ncbi:Uncharacterized protein TCM_034691 [Theobroma cacao]|uniref:Uncharacterized protein n=1 Tax=Theobroma cacao TaxID=3641 RepID=A0A061FEI3_THECC|nr:Uncharacterized protein TCM_034691 [Theobroma cacao]
MHMKLLEIFFLVFWFKETGILASKAFLSHKVVIAGWIQQHRAFPLTITWPKSRSACDQSPPILSSVRNTSTGIPPVAATPRPTAQAAPATTANDPADATTHLPSDASNPPKGKLGCATSMVWGHLTKLPCNDIADQKVSCGYCGWYSMRDFMTFVALRNLDSKFLREGSKDLDDSIFRIRSAVRDVRASPAKLQSFKIVCSKKNKSKSLVCLDVETRCNSSYLILEATLKFRKAFDSSNEETSSSSQATMKEEETDDAGDVVVYALSKYKRRAESQCKEGKSELERVTLRLPSFQSDVPLALLHATELCASSGNSHLSSWLAADNADWTAGYIGWSVLAFQSRGGPLTLEAKDAVLEQ